jgi:hypothetical protein
MRLISTWEIRTGSTSRTTGSAGIDTVRCWLRPSIRERQVSSAVSTISESCHPLAPELDLLLDDPGDVDEVFHDPAQLLNLAVEECHAAARWSRDCRPRCA